MALTYNRFRGWKRHAKGELPRTSVESPNLNKTLPLPAYLIDGPTLRGLVDAAKDCLGPAEDVVLKPFIVAAEQELEDRGSSAGRPDKPGRPAFLNWQPYGSIPCILLERFEAAPMIKAARVRITKTQGPCLEGEVYTVRDHAVTDAPEYPDHANDTVDALMLAEEFISGFEDDETQDGIGDILAGLRAAIPREQARPDLIGALTDAETCLTSTLEARGYKPGSNTDNWSREVRLEVRTLAALRETIAKLEGR